MSYDESFLKKTFRQIRPGYILAAAIVAGYIIGLIAQYIPVCTPPSSQCDVFAVDLLAQQNAMVYDHAYWQLFTSIFVTNSYGDAALNAIAVLVLDFFLPDTFDNTRYFAIFLFSAFLGNILTLSQGPFYASAGASGGIFGLFAAAFSYNWAENKKIDLSTLTLLLIIFVASSFLAPNIDWIAHVGGIIGGLISGPLLYSVIKGSNKETTEFGPSAKSSTFSKFILIAVILLLIIGSSVQFLLAVT